VIVSLAQQQIRVAAKAAVREQAWSDGRGVRGVPVRLDGESYSVENSDLTVVFDLIDGADALVWSGPELTVRVLRDRTWHIGITRPGRDGEGRDRVQVVAGDGFDRMLHRAEEAEAAAVPRTSTGCRGAGRWRLVWEVDGPDGTAIYRGPDLGLADDLYNSAPAGSHLLPVMAMAGEL
jgi:hypothetical protein